VRVTPQGRRVLSARGQVKGRTSGVVKLTTLRAPRKGGRFRPVSKRQAKLKAGRFQTTVTRFSRGRWRVRAALKGSRRAIGQQQRRLDRGKDGSGRNPAPTAGGEKVPPGVKSGGSSGIETPEAPSETLAGDSSFAPPPAPGSLPGGGYLRLGAAAPRGAVSSVQGMLTVAGYPAREDGVFDARTEEAVRRFQRARGLLVDGIVGRQRMSALREAVGDGN